MKIELVEYMENKEIAAILDRWHQESDYEMHLIEGCLYRLDLQQPTEDMTYFEIEGLIKYWVEALEGRQSVHVFEETIESEAREIQKLKKYLIEQGISL